MHLCGRFLYAGDIVGEKGLEFFQADLIGYRPAGEGIRVAVPVEMPAGGAEGDVYKRQVVRLYADDVRTDTALVRLTDQYALLALCVETPELLVFLKDRDRLLILPKRCLPAEQKDDALEFLRLVFIRKRKAVSYTHLAKLFGEIVRKLPGDRVTLTSDERFNTTIQSDVTEFTIMGRCV